MVLLDGSMQALLGAEFLSGNSVIVPQISVIVIAFFSFYASAYPIHYYAFFVGLLYDTYYLSYYGLYATLFFLMAYLIRLCSRFFKEHVILATTLEILAISYVQFSVYVFYQLTGVAHTNWQVFVVSRLWPTLLFNTLAFFILYMPLYKLRRWIFSKQ